MKPELIARIAHDINRAYCESMGDDSQVGWDEAPDWQKESALAGVKMHLASLDATPEQSHENWLEQKIAEGWTYGEEKDVEAKQHPCCVPYDELPAEQKAKDYLFRQAVHSLKDIVTADEAATAPVLLEKALAPETGREPIQYIGSRPEWRDNIYGTGLYFTTNQVRNVPYEAARKLLRHPDMFCVPELQEQDAEILDDTSELIELSQQKQDEKQEDLHAIQDLYDRIETMSKASLQEFAKVNYEQELKSSMRLDEMRAACRQYVDQFGVV